MSAGIWGIMAIAALGTNVAALFIVAGLRRRLRAAREALRTAETKLEIVECVAEVGTWDVAADSRIVEWSPQVFAIHGRPPLKGVPQPGESITYYHPDDRAMVAAAVERTLNEGEDFEFHARLIDESGRMRHVLARGAARFRDGRIDGAFGSIIEMRGHWARVDESRATADAV